MALCHYLHPPTVSLSLARLGFCLDVHTRWAEARFGTVRKPRDFRIGVDKTGSSWWLIDPFERYARQIGSSPQGSG